jgi:hypothetical protein
MGCWCGRELVRMYANAWTGLIVDIHGFIVLKQRAGLLMMTGLVCVYANETARL